MFSKIKNIRNCVLILGLLVIQSCGPSERDIEQAEHERQKVINETKLYFPQSHDNWWRIYQPNLKGAQGWIKENCNNSKIKRQRIIIGNEYLTHRSWGNYEGSLSGTLMDNDESIVIKFNCFEPDYNVGDWLNNSTR